MHFSNNFVFPFLFTKLLSEISEKNFLPLNSSYTCILRVFYVSIDTSFTNFCGQKNVVLTLNLCNFTLRLALRIYKKNFKHKSNKWNSGFSRVFYVSIDTSFTNFFRQKNVVPTLNLCNFTVRLALGIYKNIFEQIAINETRVFLVFFTFQLTPVLRTFLDRKTLFQHWTYAILQLGWRLESIKTFSNK